MSDEHRQEDLDLLLLLQRTDSAVARHEHLLQSLPEQQQLDETRDRIRVLTEEQDATRVEIDRAQPDVRRHEREIDILIARKEAEQLRLYGGEIHNPRELQAAKAEIEAVDRRVSEHEDALLEALEVIDGLETTRDQRQAEIEQLEAVAEEQATARDEAASTHLAEKAELEVTREQQRAALPDDLLDRYDATRAQHAGGAAVGELVDGSCTACRMQLSMVEVRHLKDGPQLNECPECRRLLIVNG